MGRGVGERGPGGGELPSAGVLAADQRIGWWARELERAGLDGSMDELRAQAYMDLLLGTDSRPGQDATAGTGEPRDSAVPAGAVPSGAMLAGAVRAGFAGTVNLIVPLATVLGLAERPGEIPGIGPIDPALARDLARAAQNPKTTWCVTVTDQDGHAIGHGCARPEPHSHRRKRQKPGPPDGRHPPRGTGTRDGPGFAFTASDEHGSPGGYGTWQLSTGASGQRDLLVTLEPITTDPCDHRYEAKGHDPGVKLRHLTQIRHATCTGPACRRPSTRADSDTTSRMRRAADRACVMAVRSAGTTTGSSSTPGGRPNSSRTPPSDGPPRPGASASPNQPVPHLMAGTPMLTVPAGRAGSMHP